MLELSCTGWVLMAICAVVVGLAKTALPGVGTIAVGLAVIAALKARIAGFKVPKRVHVVSELPRNTMGKVQKNLLREQHRDLFDAAAARSAASGGKPT